MMKRVGTVIAATAVGLTATVAQVSVDINLDTRHEVGGVSEFDREKYIVLHAGLRDNDWDSPTQRASFLNDYDVYLGRNNGSLPYQLRAVEEDPAAPGWVDHADLLSNGNSSRTTYGNDTAVHALEARANLMMVGGQPVMYPNGQLNGDALKDSSGNYKGDPFAITNYVALADYYEQFLSCFYGAGGADGEPKPVMVEVMNEPFVKANELGTTRANISRLHTNVAVAIKNSHPEVLVGGYTAAHPQYEGNDGNFSHWDSNWKTFIDIAGEHMDFFSLHLYDNPGGSTNVLETQYRSGSNVEALLDMVEHYSMLTLGEVKPFNISEYGSLSIFSGVPYDPKNDWVDVRSFSTIMMQLLERPDRILQAIPFMILKAEWGRDSATGYPYPTRLLYDVDELTGDPLSKDGPWAYTERIKWFELWKEVNGTRVDTVSSDPDIQVDAYVDGTNTFVVVSSLDHTGPQVVDLNLFGSFQTLETIEVKHTYVDPAGNIILDQYATNELASITLPASSTAVIKYVFAGADAPAKTSTEAKYYATTYLQPISAGAALSFSITNINTSAPFGEAMLRLGVGRAHGLSLQPLLTVNGTEVPVPTDWRGYDQSTRDQFFGVLEIPVPYELLLSNNTVTVEFGDSGGHVSSVAMQVFGFESDIRTRARMIPIDSMNFQGSELVLGISAGPTNSWFELHSITNLLANTWTVAQSGLPIDASGAGWVTNSIYAPQAFFRIVEGDAPGIPVSGIWLDPDSGTVGPGGIFRIYYAVYPDDAENKSIIWTSSDPAVATASGGLVAGVSNGTAVITAETSDGGFSDSISITVASTAADISFDDANYYKSRSFTNGTFMTVKSIYDAGTGYTVTADKDGISYKLRQIDASGSSWSVVQDYNAYDSGTVGTQSGVSEADIWIPEDITPAAGLPADNFYYLFMMFQSSDGTTYSAGTQPVIIEDPDFVPLIEFTAPDYADGDVNDHADWASSSGPWTVDATAGTVSCSSGNDNMTYLNGTALSAGQSLEFTFKYNVQGTHVPTPTDWRYLLRVGVTTNSSGVNVGYDAAGDSVSDAMFTVQSHPSTTNAFRAYGDGWNGPSGTLLTGNDADDEYAVHYSITLGSDAASTTFSVALENISKSTSAGTITETDGIGTDLYNALAAGTAYIYFETGGLGDGITGVQVNSLTRAVTP
ncbi:Ig-like domain-containing protein [Pontiellaceae bacterium B12227]|nr:Ig-like domain-containing protein [Pontiellaceae bacterium B12227]